MIKWRLPDVAKAFAEAFAPLGRRAAIEAAENVSERFREEVVKNASLRDHSLEDLRRMGHPYGRGSRQLIGGRFRGQLRSPIPHDPEWLVHTQDGDLVRSIKKTIATGVGKFFDPNVVDPSLATVDRDPVTGRFTTITGMVFIDLTIAPHAEFVMTGTRAMVARPFLAETFELFDWYGELQKELRKHGFK